MSRYYNMQGEQVSFEEGMRLYSDDFNDTRRVAWDEIDGVRISTVLLVIDHNFGSGPPLIFETMIFGGGDGLDEYQERYSTREQAEAGHARAVALVRSTPQLTGGNQ